MARDFDLLGDPIPANHGKPGANGHTPNAKSLNKVRMLHVAGVPKKEIAEELGISQPTLNKHYFQNGRLNLKDARAAARKQARAKILLRLDEAADAGNVSAMKAIKAILDEEDMAELARQAVGDDAPKRKEAPLPKGKKEQLTAEAAAVIEDDDLLNPERFH
ncbi:hypothetical protein [Pseudooceanicola nanhaiensis]|uniref:hypothetical protein n=1 Tax=Pseudooceanicola nanhaiensis TaxID=375761 RepID=UPI001CD51416|nr:hypothetical protein [Pseudooceanicola nanhaiensis]MCA0922181.1 hypothetical protein [Pseudooceanicola nanhaiensis]